MKSLVGIKENRRSLSRRCTLEGIASWENLLLAATRARRGKTRRPDVEDWWMRRETELTRLQRELLDRSWIPGPYRHFLIHEPKRREIAAAPFGDRVVHHALCSQLAPVLERRFIARSFSCQLGKGTTAARECCRKLVNQHRFVLKCDIQKFFPNIDHQLLTQKLAPWVACKGARWLMEKVLGSFETGTMFPPVLLPGDDWVECVQRPRGVPIGNLTSQLWGNFFLDSLDHLITEGLAHGAYLRYTDDFLLFGDDKERLWSLRGTIVEHLACLRLKLSEPKSRLLTTSEGVPFCGFCFYPDRRPRVLGATKRRFEQRRDRWIRLRQVRRLSQTVFAWYQFSREGNTHGLRKAYSVPRRP